MSNNTTSSSGYTKKKYQKKKYIKQIPYGYPKGVNNKLEAEIKSIDLEDSGKTLNTSGIIFPVNLCERGDDINMRIGRQIFMNNMSLHLMCTTTPSTGIASVYRVLIVYDKQTNGAQPAITDVIKAVPINTTHMNLNNRNRFQLIKDSGPILLSGASGDYPMKVSFFYKKLDLKTTFNEGTAGTIADIVTGGLFVIVASTSPPGSTAGTFDYRCRVRFTDY